MSDDRTRVSALDTSEAHARMIDSLTGNSVYSLTEIISLQEAHELSLERMLFDDRGWEWGIKMQNNELLLRASNERKRETVLETVFKSLIREVSGGEEERGIKDRVKGMTQ